MDDQVYQSQIDPLDILSLPTLFKVVPKCGKNGAIIHFQLQSTHWANPSVNQALSFSLFSLNGLCRIPQCPIVINVRYGGGVLLQLLWMTWNLGYLPMQLTCVFFPCSGLISRIPHTGLHVALRLGPSNRPQLASGASRYMGMWCSMVQVFSLFSA